MTRIAIALAVGLLAASGATFASVSGPDDPPRPDRDSGAPDADGGAPKADRDGDKVFDDLEEKIAGRNRGERVRVIVKLEKPATGKRVRELKRRVGDFSVKYRYSVVKAFAGRVTVGQVRALARQSVVVHVEEDSRVHALNDSTQSSFGVTAARNDAAGLDGNSDGDAGSYSKDDRVAAVIDTGIDPDHLDLDGGKVIAFKDFVNDETTAYDDEGHGTHVSGTIAGDGDGHPDKLYKGAAPNAALVGVKVLNQNGSGTMSDVTAGIDWVVQNKATYGIEAINLSLGASGCADGTDSTSLAVNNAHDAGIVVAVAAGNEGPGTCTIGSPGAAAKALTVGAMADMGELGFYQAYFSSRGPTADGRIKPDVSAPGVDVTSAQSGTTNGYDTFSGTSMATPFVAGVALLMRDATPSLTSQQVKDKIRETAIDWARGGDNTSVGGTGPDIDYGAGRLDAYAAIKSAGAAIDSPPVMPAHDLREGSLSGTGAQVDHSVEVKETNLPIAATMIISDVETGTSRDPDFDLYLIDPSGTQVDESEFITRQEEVQLLPTMTGTWTVRVKSYRGSGNYFVDISAPTEDTTPPAAPTGLTATPGDGEVALDWSDNSESDLAGYNVYRSTSAGGPYNKLNGSLLTTSQYTDSSANNGTTYFYVVKAVDTSGNLSNSSAEVSAIPGALEVRADFNGDGFADLAVGAPGEDGSGSATDIGVVNVLYGSASGLASAGARQFTQTQAGGPDDGADDRFGAAVG